MIRAVGAGLIFLACSAFGLMLSDRLKAEKERVSALLSLFGRLEAYIRWNSYTLREIFMRTDDERLGFTKRLREYLSEDMPFPAAWEKALSHDRQLTADEKELLYELGSSLGRTDTQGQLSVIGLVSEKGRELLKKVSDKYTSKGKMYRSLGIALGAMVGIIMV